MDRSVAASWPRCASMPARTSSGSAIFSRCSSRTRLDRTVRTTPSAAMAGGIARRGRALSERQGAAQRARRPHAGALKTAPNVVDLELRRLENATRERHAKLHETMRATSRRPGRRSSRCSRARSPCPRARTRARGSTPLPAGSCSAHKKKKTPRRTFEGFRGRPRRAALRGERAAPAADASLVYTSLVMRGSRTTHAYLLAHVRSRTRARTPPQTPSSPPRNGEPRSLASRHPNACAAARQDVEIGSLQWDLASSLTPVPDRPSEKRRFIGPIA
jgi:hypothetical protein